MEERADLLFRRWCVRGDVESLGELFDLVAPRLLGVAIHVVGDPSEAEDLVQATFLAAVQGRGEIDAARPALPWLMGVLAHKATDLRRRRGRSVPVDVDWQQVLGSESTDPTRRAETLELEGQVAKAIDSLGEPDRRVLLLRLRHGMAIADIAHLLDKSPGSVRVQLHRGFKKLRERLPVSYAGLGALAMALGGSRGLDVVRAEVVRAASVPVVLGTSTFWIGAWVMAQKHVWIGVAAVLMAALGAWSWMDPGTAPSVPTSAPREGAEELESARTDSLSSVSDGAGTVGDSRRAAEGSVDPGFRVRGRVLDAESGAPIEGALVELHAPREHVLNEALSDWPELFYVETNGRPRPRTRGDWPRIEGLSGPARFGHEPFRLYGWANPDAEPIATARTGKDGTFSLPSGPRGGVLLVEHRDYGRRTRAAHDPRSNWDVELRGMRRFVGRVMVDGGAPGEPLHLAISGHGEFVLPEGAELPYSHKPEDVEGLGSWTALTDPSGHFEVDVAADEVLVGFLDPGWRSQGGEGLYSVSDEALIFASRFPVMEITDAQSGTPIERVRMLGRELQDRYVRWSGEYVAPGGLLTLPGSGTLLQWHRKDTLAFTVWAEGYAETSLTLTEIGSKDVIPVQLEPGETPGVRGQVLLDGKPLAGVEVALLGHSPLQWSEDEDTLIDSLRSDDRGVFSLVGPSGPALFRVTGPGGLYFELVELPYPGELVIDLAKTGTIVGEVRDSEGTPRVGHIVALGGGDGRSFRTHSDEEGAFRFEDLSPGTWNVMSPFLSTESSFAADVLIEVDMTRGGHREVTVEVPVVGSDRHAWVVSSGTLDYAGWRVRYGGGDWSPLDPDGRIPMDLTTESFRMRVEAPDARAWSVPIPKMAEDGHRVHLDPGVESYRGVLLDAEGEALAGVRIFAESLESRGTDVPVASTVTDGAGLFELRGLAAGKQELQVHSDPERNRSYEYDSDYRGMRLRPHLEPGDGVWLELRMPSRPTTSRVEGSVFDSAGEGVANAMLYFRSMNESDTGTWSFSTDQGLVHTDSEGRFEVMLPEAELRGISVYLEGESQSVLSVEIHASEDESAIELRLPE